MINIKVNQLNVCINYECMRLKGIKLVNSNKTREFMWGEDEEKLGMYT